MTTCNTCSSAIPDPAERWPGRGSGGTLCQECWEAESSASWWATVRALDEAGLLAPCLDALDNA
jgi:hypothetical protein